MNSRSFIDGKPIGDISIKRFFFLELPVIMLVIIGAIILLPFAYVYSKIFE
jgi:hypothetical protein